MMNILSLLLLATSLVAGNSSTTLRGADNSAAVVEIIDQESQGRRHLQESTCTLYRKCVTYGADETHPDGHHEDSWVCKLDTRDEDRTGTQYVDIVDRSTLEAIGDATSGESTLTVSQAVIEEDNTMTVPLMAKVQVRHNIFDDRNQDSTRDEREKKTRRKLADKTGTLNTLVIRVKDKNNVSTNATVAGLKDDVFLDAASLKTQMESCSHDKLKIQPFSGKTPSNFNVQGGVVEVKLNDYDVSRTKDENGGKNIHNAAMTAAKAQLGNLDDDMFDLVLFCFPPGTGSISGIAFAYANSKYTFYKDNWCSYSSSQMHEVGHNLGLGHSGTWNGKDEFDLEYGDGTGMMGSSTHRDDVKMCYNPSKSFQLGWYSDKTETLLPLQMADGYKDYVINGIDDYKKNNNALIALRLKQTQNEPDYYLGYNKAAGITSDTSEDENKITIVLKEKGDPNKYSLSSKVAALAPGQSHVLQNFDGKSVKIQFLGLDNDDAKVRIIDVANYNPPPIKCIDYVVEVTTDQYPDDAIWEITGKNEYGAVTVAESPEYETANKFYKHDICIPQGKSDATFKFIIYDNYGDGFKSGGFKFYEKNGPIVASYFTTRQEFKSKTYSFVVPKDPNPVVYTRSPTEAPTPTPECEDYEIEVQTDKYPQDASWKFFVENSYQDAVEAPGLARASFPSGESNRYKIYKDTVCLTKGRTYHFHYYDSHGDGICCNAGEGWYKVRNSAGQVIIDSKKVNVEFKEQTHEIKIPRVTDDTTPAPVPSPTPAPTKAPTSPPVSAPDNDDLQCTNTPNDEWTYRGKKNKHCDWIAKKPANKRKKWCGRWANTKQDKENKVYMYCGEACKDAGHAKACKP